MGDLDDPASNYNNNTWIYIGADARNENWAKVGKTTIGLHTRHTSTQNPNFYIHTAFNIINGDVHMIETKLKKHLEHAHDLTPIPHISTGEPSECFELNAMDMTHLVEQYIDKNFSGCVTFENSLHGNMSRYRSDININKSTEDSSDGLKRPLQAARDRTPSRNRYYSGNQEIYEVDLGNGYYQDLESCEITHRDEDDQMGERI